MKIEHGVNENPSFTPTCFGTQQKGESSDKLILLYLLVDIKTFLIIPNNILY